MQDSQSLGCSTCFNKYGSLLRYRRHLNHHRRSGTLKNISCPLCSISFNRITNLVRHLRNVHRVPDILSLDIEGDDSESNAFQISIERDDGHAPYDTIEESVSESMSSKRMGIFTCAEEAFRLVTALQARAAVPMRLIPSIVEAGNNLVNNAVVDVLLDVCSILQEQGIFSEEIKCRLSSLSSKYSSPLSQFDSVPKLEWQIANHPCYVEPKQVHLGSRYVRRKVRGVLTDVLVEDSFHYTSIMSTLKVILRNPEYREKVMSPIPRSSTKISHFCHGSAFGRNLITREKNNVLFLQLFYDDMSTTNPLRRKCAKQTVAIFYFSVLNLPQHYRSSFPNVHTFAVCSTRHIKGKYGFGPIIDYIFQELKILETDGFNVDIGNNETVSFHGVLGQVVGDCLALNGILGFIQCFSWDYWCLLCYAKKSDLREKHKESDFLLRTSETYVEDLNEVLQSGANHVRGVKFKSVFENLEYYSMFSAPSLDPMHVLLEGIVPKEIEIILEVLSFEQLLTANVFKSLTEAFFQCLGDSSITPPVINFSLHGFTATQTWALLRYLPLILSEKVDAPSLLQSTGRAADSWRLLLLLSEVVDITFARDFDHRMIVRYAELIERHNRLFVELFPEQSVIPKMHLLVHFPSLVAKCGPPVTFCCFRYELRNAVFKKFSHNMNNFKNTTKTLAKKNAIFELDNCLNNSHIRDFILVTAEKAIIDDEFHFNCSSISVNGTIYKSGHHFVFIKRITEAEIQVAKIERIVRKDDSGFWNFVLRICSGYLIRASWAYRIETQNDSIVKSVLEFAGKPPLVVVKDMLRLKYWI